MNAGSKTKKIILNRIVVLGKLANMSSVRWRFFYYY